MLACAACDGFLPDGTSACPNCDARPSATRRALTVAAGAAVMMTLMACYGGPMGPNLPACISTKLTGNGAVQGATKDCEPPKDSSRCTNGSQPFGVVSYQPETTEAGRPGKLRVDWTVIDNVVTDPGLEIYLLAPTPPSDTVGACVAPQFSGTVSFDVARNDGYDIVLAGANAGVYSKFQVTVAFTPKFTPQ